jgi:hypothetical protein
VVVACAAALAADIRVADACSCGAATYISPVDGATGVPRSAEIAVQRPEPVSIPVLRDSLGNAVAVSERSAKGLIFADWVILRPDQPLAPNSLYQVEYAGTTTTFTTGQGLGIRLPAPAPVERLSMAHATIAEDCGNSCSPFDSYSRADFRYEPSDGIAYYELVFTTPTERWTRLVLPGFPAQMNNSVCGYQPPVILPDEIWCVALVAVATTGEKVRADSPACTQVIGCDPLTCDGGEACLEPDFEPGPTVPFDAPDPTPDISGGCSAGGSGFGAGVFFIGLFIAARRRLGLLLD